VRQPTDIAAVVADCHNHPFFRWRCWQLSEAALLVQLRDPAYRAVSHFHFAKTLPWTAGRRMRNLTLEEYLRDPAEMLATREIWGDGEGGTSYLAGTSTQPWVFPVNKTETELIRREKAMEDIPAILKMAAARLQQALWVSSVRFGSSKSAFFSPV